MLTSSSRKRTMKLAVHGAIMSLLSAHLTATELLDCPTSSIVGAGTPRPAHHLDAAAVFDNRDLPRIPFRSIGPLPLPLRCRTSFSSQAGGGNPRRAYFIYGFKWRMHLPQKWWKTWWPPHFCAGLMEKDLIARTKSDHDWTNKTRTDQRLCSSWGSMSDQEALQ